MSDEITTEEALDTLVDDEEEIVSEEDQSLPRLRFAVQHFEDVPRYKAPLSGERKTRFDRWKVDEALTDLRSAVGSWAEENGYKIYDNTTEVFDEPIDEQLVANLEGEIDTGDNTIDFVFHGGKKNFPLSTTSHAYNDNPGGTILTAYDGFDGSMTEEYRELNAITEAVISKYGKIVMNNPDCL